MCSVRAKIYAPTESARAALLSLYKRLKDSRPLSSILTLVLSTFLNTHFARSTIRNGRQGWQS